MSIMTVDVYLNASLTFFVSYLWHTTYHYMHIINENEWRADCIMGSCSHSTIFVWKRWLGSDSEKNQSCSLEWTATPFSPSRRTTTVVVMLTLSHEIIKDINPTSKSQYILVHVDGTGRPSWSSTRCSSGLRTQLVHRAVQVSPRHSFGWWDCVPERRKDINENGVWICVRCLQKLRWSIEMTETAEWDARGYELAS